MLEELSYDARAFGPRVMCSEPQLKRYTAYILLKTQRVLEKSICQENHTSLCTWSSTNYWTLFAIMNRQKVLPNFSKARVAC